MKLFKTLFISSLALLFVSTAVIAGDFGWIKDYNIHAQADPSGIKASLATRFNLGVVDVEAILGNCASPADAYIILSLGEISGRPTNFVVNKYNNNKSKGWGALAKSLGIKPGSEEFHALKQGHALKSGDTRAQISYSNYDHKNVNYVDNAHGKKKKRK